MARTVEDVALLWSVLTGVAVPEPRLDGLTVGLLRQRADARRRARDRAERRGRELGRPSSSGSARGSSRRRFPSRPRDTWPVFLHEARESTARRSPSRADEYGDTSCRPKLEAAQRVAPDDVSSGLRARSRTGARYEPDVDLYVSPCFAHRAAARGRRRARGPAAALVVPALGQPDRLGRARDRQPAAVAPHDETVLAAGLAWERGKLRTPVRGVATADCRCCALRSLAALSQRLRQGRAEALGRSPRAWRNSASRRAPTRRRSACPARRASS